MLRCVFSVIVLTAGVSSLRGQYLDLDVNHDGSVAYFVTPMRQVRTEQPFHGKLFRVTDGAVALDEQREMLPPASFPQGPGQYRVSNVYDIFGVSMSSDNGTVAVMAHASCYGDGILCAKSVELHRTTIRTSTATRIFDGALFLSHNGEWAFGGSSLYSISPIQMAYLVDVRAGTSRTLRIMNSAGRAQISRFRPISDTGVATYCDGDSVVIVEGNESRRIYAEARARPSDASLNAEATSVVFSAPHPLSNASGSPGEPPQAVFIAPVAGGAPTLVSDEGSQPRFADDGVTIYFYRGQGGDRQLWIATPGADPTQLTQIASGISFADVSGDGRRAFAFTNDGRFVALELTTGKTTELLSPTPNLTPWQSTARSKLSVFHGTGLLSFDAATMVVGGKPARVLSASDTALAVLVPPDIAVTMDRETTISFQPGPQSPFEGLPTKAVILDSFPEFFRDITQMAIGAHESWDSMISVEAPARRGETVHLFGSGMGRTVPEVPFGSVTPASEPLPVLARPYACVAQPGNLPLRTSYQGLAPGMIGVYQFDLQIPSVWSNKLLRLVCLDEGSGDGGMIAYIPVQ